MSRNSTRNNASVGMKAAWTRKIFGPWAAVLLGAAVFGTAFAAQAQERVVQEADRTVYRQRTVIDFTGVTLEGELKKPEGTVMLHRGQTQFQSLIQLRGDFQQELERSVDQL